MDGTHAGKAGTFPVRHEYAHLKDDAELNELEKL